MEAYARGRSWQSIQRMLLYIKRSGRSAPAVEHRHIAPLGLHLGCGCSNKYRRKQKHNGQYTLFVLKPNLFTALL